MYDHYDYDYKPLKHRILKEIEDIENYKEWNAECVCILERLLHSVKHIERIEELDNMEWDYDSTANERKPLTEVKR